MSFGPFPNDPGLGITIPQLPPQAVLASRYLRPSGGDDSAAMIDALTNFAPFAYPTIVLGPGTFLWNSAVPAFARSTPTTVTGAGIGKTIIQLSGGAPRAFDFNKIADYDTFSQITLQDFTVDCNNIGGLHHVVIGTKQAGVNQYLLNFDQITVRRVQTINVPSCQTLGNYATNVNNRLNIALAGWHHNNPGNDIQTVITNILIEDCDFKGGNVGIVVAGGGGQGVAQAPTALAAVPSGVGGTLPTDTYFYRVVGFDNNGNPGKMSAEVTAAVVGPTGSVALTWAAGAGDGPNYQVWRGTAYGREDTFYTVNGATAFIDTGAAGTIGRMPIGVDCFIDNIVIQRIRTSTLGVPAQYGTQQGIQIGSLGFGGKYTVRDCYGFGYADNFIEIDGNSFALIENCLADGLGAGTVDGYTLGAFSTPRDRTRTTIYRNCGVRYGDGAGGVLGISPPGWGINGLDCADSFPGAYVGPVVLDGCYVLDTSGDWGCNGRIARIAGAIPRVSIINTRLEQPTKKISLTASITEYGITWAGITNAIDYPCRLIIRDTSMDVRGTVALNAFSEGWASVLLSAGTFSLDIDNLVTTVNLPGSANHSHAGIYIPNSTIGTQILPSLIKRYVPSQVGDNAAQGLTVGDTAHVVITDKLVLEECDFTKLGGGSSELSLSVPSAAAKIFLIRPRYHGAFPVAQSAIAVTASPFVYNNLDGYPEAITVQGGAVTKIEYSTGGAYFDTGVTQGVFRLDNSDFMRVTYTVAPTMEKFPLNK